MTQAYFAKTDHPFELQSATYLTTLLDFSDPGDLGAFIDEDQVAELEKRMADKGYLEAQDLQLSFNMLRPDDLIWSFFVNNYLMGERPAAFDLLFWNSDSTRLPAAMHSFYLRNMYLENNLITPNAITVDGVGVDLTKIETPNIFISTERDHIAPWKATYQGAKSIGGDQPVSDFILAESGHIAGVINPPAKQKYGHWVGKGGALPDNPDDWKDQARFIKQASWWPSWQDWIADYTGDKVKARNITDGLCDAPGKYVRE
jgi:polyhydroxyalkanoate synthase